MSADLPQDEADSLLAMQKKSDKASIRIPDSGEAVTVGLTSIDSKERFLLDITRSKIKLTKSTLQTRGRQVVVLARLDVDGPPHENPDGEEIPCPHLHLYREGYGDRWAFEVPAERFSDVGNFHVLLSDFMRFCNVPHLPDFASGIQL